MGMAGGATVEMGNFLSYIVPTYICVGIAMVGTNVIYQLRSEVTKAHHMGSYKLVEQLGSGGMGEVWRAEHRMLARPAAIKLIRGDTLGARDDFGRRELLTRFNREAQATASLSSPHTVQLYDFGVTDDGVFYYVMELLHGMDAASLVERFGPLPPERTIDLLRQVCESLSEAHGIGLIHRDIKPANVFVCKLGARYDVAKLLDFGLVKASGAWAKEDTQVTLPSVATGTPAFMAPEMVTGASEIDGRADIYALGCVAYWLLTGELVFSEGTPMQVAFAHVNTAPEPPSRRSELEIPEAIEKAVMSCLEKDRENRPQTAKELGELLAAAGGENRWNQSRAVQWWNDYVPDLATEASPTAKRP
jgi:serine/threonine-protein kinase